MVGDLAHVIQFFQTGFTILLGLALGEALKQLVPDGDKPIRGDRVPLLLAFLFVIFPFFHGMSQHFYTTYLTQTNAKLAPVAVRVMFDGLIFMVLAAIFFGMCRSLSPAHWVRFFGFLLCLLLVDSVWIIVSISLYKAQTLPWLILNLILAVILLFVLWAWRSKWSPTSADTPQGPLWICAIATLLTTAASYLWMKDFYFS